MLFGRRKPRIFGIHSALPKKNEFRFFRAITSPLSGEKLDGRLIEQNREVDRSEKVHETQTKRARSRSG
jgi:hypothetical protein